MKRLLIVEDDDDLREVLHDVLRLEWQIASSPNETTALELLNTFKPDVALIDLQLEDGPADLIIRACRDQGIPHIMMTGGSDEGPPGSTLIRKPFLADDLRLLLLNTCP